MAEEAAEAEWLRVAESLPRWVESAYTALQSVPLPTYTATGEQEDECGEEEDRRRRRRRRW